MPGYDGSGPRGGGPMTGGGRGMCNPENAEYRSQFVNAFGMGRGMGTGRGFRGGNTTGMGRGAGRRFTMNQFAGPETYPVNTREALGMLKEQADLMKNTLDTLNMRIAELEKAPE